MLKKAFSYFQRLRLSGVEYARWNGVKVGEDCRIYSYQWGSEPFLIEFGDHVTVSSEVLFITHDGAAWLIRDDKPRRFAVGPIHVGSWVFIGARSIIMPRVQIGDRVIIGSGAVVTKSIPSNSVVAGNPARFICSYDDYVLNGKNTLPDETEQSGKSYEERRKSLANFKFKDDISRSRI